MKPFLLFGGDNLLPIGGMRNYCDSFNTIEEAEAYGMRCNFDWFQVVEHATMKVVKTFDVEKTYEE